MAAAMLTQPGVDTLPHLGVILKEPSKCRNDGRCAHIKKWLQVFFSLNILCISFIVLIVL